MTRARRHRVPIALVVLATLAGGALRFWKLGASCLWLDEVVTAQVARGGARAIARYVSADIGPRFLSFFFESLTIQFGAGEFFVRLPTAIFGTLAIPLAAWGAWLASRRAWAAAWAAVLVAFSNHLLYYSREARGYALLTLLGLTSFVATRLALERASLARRRGVGPAARAWTVTAALNLAGLFTSYFHAFAMAALAVYGLGWIALGARRGRGRAALGLALSLIVPALIFLPWGLDGRHALARYGAGHLAQAAPNVLKWLGACFAAWTPGTRWHFVLAASLALYGGVFGDRRRRRGLLAVFVALMIAVPAVAFRLVSFGHFLHPRYLVAVAPFFWMTVAVGLARLPEDLARLAGPRRAKAARWTGAAAAGLLLAGYMAANLSLYAQWAGAQKQDWRGVAAYLKAHYQPGEVIAPSFDRTWQCLAEYLPTELRPAIWTDHVDMPDRLGPLARSGQRIWYVVPEYCLWEAPELERWLETYFQRRTIIRGYDMNVRIYYYASAPKP